jgi:hypothetical protein
MHFDSDDFDSMSAGEDEILPVCAIYEIESEMADVESGPHGVDVCPYVQNRV